MICESCGTYIDVLEAFPNSLCLDCYKDTPDGRYIPTASELRQIWGIDNA